MVADTAAAAGVKVFVFSTLEDVEKRSKVLRQCCARATGRLSALHRGEKEVGCDLPS